MRLMINGKDHPFKTESGYSIALRYMSHYLVQDHDIAIFAPVGNSFSMDYVKDERVLPDGKVEEYSIPIYPGTAFDYGEDIQSYHYDDFKADALFLMVDVWALKDPGASPPGILGHSRRGKFKTILVAPVDYVEPLPPKMIEYFNSVYRVVPWCQSAADILRRAGVKNVLEPIPLGLDTQDMWKRLDRKTLPKFMTSMGFDPDGKTFNILLVGANQFMRKCWSETFAAIAMFRKQYPESNPRIYIHSPTFGGSQDWDMQSLADFHGLKDITIGLDNYQYMTGRYTEVQMVKMYNVADVVINAGMEGFGYSTLQSQAVGIPCIGLNAGCTPDLLRYGALVEPKQRIQMPTLLTNVFPIPEDIAEALVLIYLNGQEKFTEQRDETIQWVKDTFDWKVVMAKWKTTLQQIESDLNHDCELRSAYPPKPASWNLERAKKEIILK